MQKLLNKLDPNSSIPVGLATKLGTLVAAISAVCAAILPLLDGDQTPEVIAVLAAGGAALYKVLDGRYQQAAARENAKAVTNVANAITDEATVPPELDLEDDDEDGYVVSDPAHEKRDLHDAEGA
jgi:hypothetical protein